jgi:T4-like virus Myoviridae tail sheath stabiliser
MAQYFYDQQIRRFLIQFARIFSDWNVTKGKDPAGNDIIVRVPIQYGDPSRQAAVVQANNSPSSLPSAPLVTYYITGLEYDQKRTQDPYFIDKVNVRQRNFNQTTQSYETTQGQAFTVERIMPVPYTLRISVDFWTSNYQQKLELIEQIGVLFNPSMELQSTDNFIDWTSLSVVYQDGLTFSSRSVPQGSGNSIDIMNWKFYMPIWLSSSAKITKMGVIHKIIASIFQGNALSDMQDDHLLLGTRQKITPYGYKLLLIGNTLQIVPANQTFYPDNSAIDLPPNPNTTLYWTSVLNVYGAVRPGISQIWLQNPHMDTDIVGTINFNPDDDRLLIFNIDKDTLPLNTIKTVDSIINPQLKGPNFGLPTVTNGQRYLIVEPLGGVSTNSIDNGIWGNVIANANDIIEYNGTTGRWNVSFNSQATTTTEYVTNLTTGIQYRFANNSWIKSFEGWYDQGDYNIVI